MLEESQRTRRLRPSTVSFGAACVFLALAVYLASALVAGPPLAAMLAITPLIGLGVCYYRVRGLGSRLPAPWGKGKVSYVSLRRTTLQGALIVVAGVAFLMVPFVALFFIPGGVVILGILALMGGLATSELLTFVWITRLERALKGKIIQITELSEEEGKQVLLKSIELQGERPPKPRDWPPVTNHRGP